jgi:integrase
MEDDRKYLTEEELARFLKVITDPRDRAIFTVMYWRGLRASEPGRIPLSAFRQAAGRLYVTRRKGSEAGEYPLSPAELRVLKAWVKISGQKPGPLFPSREGGGISRFMLHNLMRIYGTRAGLPTGKLLKKHRLNPKLFHFPPTVPPEPLPDFTGS